MYQPMQSTQVRVLDGLAGDGLGFEGSFAISKFRTKLMILRGHFLNDLFAYKFDEHMMSSEAKYFCRITERLAGILGKIQACDF